MKSNTYNLITLSNGHWTVLWTGWQQQTQAPTVRVCLHWAFLWLFVYNRNQWVKCSSQSVFRKFYWGIQYCRLMHIIGYAQCLHIMLFKDAWSSSVVFKSLFSICLSFIYFTRMLTLLFSMVWKTFIHCVWAKRGPQNKLPLCNKTCEFFVWNFRHTKF